MIGQEQATNEDAFDPDLFDGGHVVAAGVRTADGHRHDGIETCVAVSYPLPAHDAGRSSSNLY